MNAINPLVAGLALPPIPAVQAWGRSYNGAMGPLIDLSQAVPGYPPHPDLLAWLAEAAGSVSLAGYGEIEGEPRLRETYAAHLSALYGVGLAAGNVHVTSGCNQAFVTAAMVAAGPGDAVLLTNPCYFNHETTLAMLGIQPRYVECHAENGFLPDPADIDAKIDGRMRAVALVSPNNPTGAVYPPALLAEIMALCRRRGVWLILDETYRDFLPAGAGAPQGLFGETGWEETLIGLYSFSKSFCIPGHRLGAVTAGPRVVAAIAAIMDNLQICAPRPPQIAVARGLPALADWREGNRREIERRAEAMRTVMAEVDGWRIDALGAYFAFLRHPFEGVDATRVAEALARQAGIVAIPGGFFGAGREDYLRIAFANVDTDGIREFARRLRGFAP